MNNNKFSKFKKIILCSNNENFEYFNYHLLSKLKIRVLRIAKKKKVFFKMNLQKYTLADLMLEIKDL